MKKILFITPTLARTGSEMVLWYLVKNLDPSKYKIHLFSVQKGELFEVLPTHVEKTTSYKYSGSLLKKVVRGILKALGINVLAYQLKQIHRQFKPELWFVNTIVVPDAHLAARDLNVKLVTYFHEIDNAFSFIKDFQLQRILEVSHYCLGCSEIVVKKIQEMGHNNVKLQNSFINNELIRVDQHRVEELRKKLGIDPDDFVWVVSGTANYMKGVDLVLPVLEYFRDKKVKIIWIGASLKTGIDYYVKTSAERQYPGKLIFTGPLSEDYYTYLKLGNGLLILSREETFSLVMVEAAFLQMPIVGYNFGVIDRFVEHGMGKIINGINSHQLCINMELIQNNPDLIDRKRLKDKAMQYTVKNQIDTFEKTLTDILATSL